MFSGSNTPIPLPYYSNPREQLRGSSGQLGQGSITSTSTIFGFGQAPANSTQFGQSPVSSNPVAQQSPNAPLVGSSDPRPAPVFGWGCILNNNIPKPFGSNASAPSQNSQFTFGLPAAPGDSNAFRFPQAEPRQPVDSCKGQEAEAKLQIQPLCNITSTEHTSQHGFSNGAGGFINPATNRTTRPTTAPAFGDGVSMNGCQTGFGTEPFSFGAKSVKQNQQPISSSASGNPLNTEALSNLAAQLSQIQAQLRGLEQQQNQLFHLTQQLQLEQKKMQQVIISTLRGTPLSLSTCNAANGQQHGGRRGCGLICTRPDYYIYPQLEELDRMVDAEGNCIVTGFEVERENFGKIRFLSPVNVANLNIDAIIHFRDRGVLVYPNANTKDPIGQGLNGPAEIELVGEWSAEEMPCGQYTYDKFSTILRSGSSGVEEDRNALRKASNGWDPEFIFYLYDESEGEGLLKFRVSHFGL